jgi:hypothetical protein
MRCRVGPPTSSTRATSSRLYAAGSSCPRLHCRSVARADFAASHDRPEADPGRHIVSDSPRVVAPEVVARVARSVAELRQCRCPRPLTGLVPHRPDVTAGVATLCFATQQASAVVTGTDAHRGRSIPRASARSRLHRLSRAPRRTRSRAGCRSTAAAARGGVGEGDSVRHRGDVVATDANARHVELTTADRRMGGAQLPHRRHLGHGDVVEHPQGAEDDGCQQQAAEIEAGARPAG